MRRDKHELEQDRADLLAVLVEARTDLRTDTLICRANGMADPAVTDRSWWRHYSRGHTDLRALERQGKIVPVRNPNAYFTRWKLATELEVDAESDRDEVARMMAQWELDAPGGAV